MEQTKFGQNFFESTRGRIVILLRRGVGTVEELARELELTDNAVRAHLATLERDGLIERRGMRRGLRKPHFAYALTDEAEQLFPKAYSTLFNQLLAVLKNRLDPVEVRSILREVAHSLAARHDWRPDANESLESRAQRALAEMETLGGVPEIKTKDDKFFIHSLASCPFAATAAEHPEICHLAEVLLSEITGLEVKEHCQGGHAPKCSFEIIGGLGA